jgi:hypothetical protein
MINGWAGVLIRFFFAQGRGAGGTRSETKSGYIVTASILSEPL